MLAVAPQGNVGRAEELMEAVAPRPNVGAKVSLIFAVALRGKLGAKVSLTFAVAARSRLRFPSTALSEPTVAPRLAVAELRNAEEIAVVAALGKPNTAGALMLAVLDLVMAEVFTKALPELTVVDGLATTCCLYELLNVTVLTGGFPGASTMESVYVNSEALGKFGAMVEVTETVPPRGNVKLFLKPVVMLAVAPRGKTGVTEEVILAVDDLLFVRLAKGADETLVRLLGILLTPVNWSIVVPPVIVVLIW